MRNAAHSGNHPASCPACLTRAKLEAPLDRDPLDHIATRSDAFEKLHRSTIRAREKCRARDSAMRDLGLVKVRGALGGTYWE